MSKKLGSWFDWAAAFDIHPVNIKMDLLQKIHAGLRFGLPLMDLFVGYNGGYASYGAVVDFYLLEIGVGVYGQEVGNHKKTRKAIGWCFT